MNIADNFPDIGITAMQMRVIDAKPPNWDKIAAAFPVAGKHDPTFVYQHRISQIQRFGLSTA